MQHFAGDMGYPLPEISDLVPSSPTGVQTGRSNVHRQDGILALDGP